MVSHAEKTAAASRAAIRNSKIRDAYIQKVTAGDMTFPQLVKMSKEPGLEALKKIRVVDLLSKFPGWTMSSARHAFLENNLNERLRVSQSHHERILDVVSMLMNASASSWKKRTKAPRGWPWFGNIANTLADLEESDLPREIREVRYRFADEEHIQKREEEKTARDVSNDISAFLGDDSDDVTSTREEARKESRENTREESPQEDDFSGGIDNLDDLFGDLGDDTDDVEETETKTEPVPKQEKKPDPAPASHSDDFLDDLFGGDDDDDDKESDTEYIDEEEDDDDTLTDEEINKMLGF